MLLWFAGLSFLLVWQVFKDPAIDYRLVMGGALLPDVIDAPWGGPAVAHAVLGPAVLLVVVMLATRHRRGLRRRALALPIGVFGHLLLDGAWLDSEVFWWPFLGGDLGGDGLPSLDRPVAVVVAMELAGAAALAWCARRFRLLEPTRRRALLRTGRLGRDVA